MTLSYETRIKNLIRRIENPKEVELRKKLGVENKEELLEKLKDKGLLSNQFLENDDE